MHSRGKAHLDVKMENVLLDDQGNAVLADLGFAACLEGDGEDRDGSLRRNGGTRPYMPPERLIGAPYKGTDADLFSLVLSCPNHPSFM